jgi:glycine/D-amino acid oxidase-like deaminating enzyme
MKKRIDCDLLVAGSGAAGLTAAVTAAAHGLKVVVAEKDPVFGGTTAWAGGWTWAPRNPLARRAGIVEDIEQPRTYLRNVLGAHFDEAKVDAFLEAAPQMVAFFEEKTAVRFEDGNKIPDTYGDVPGAAAGGHQVIAAPYDARELGDLIARLRRPMRETTFLGLTIQAGPDLRAFMNVTSSPRAFLYVALRVSRHFIDLVLYGRAMQLRNGLALVARLLRSAADLGVELRSSSPVVRLLQVDGVVRGAILHTAEGEIEVIARRGLVLATGGFPHDAERRRVTFGTQGTVFQDRAGQFDQLASLALGTPTLHRQSHLVPSGLRVHHFRRLISLSVSVAISLSATTARAGARRSPQSQKLGATSANRECISLRSANSGRTATSPRAVVRRRYRTGAAGRR